jgi:hypothetical protein
VTVAAIVRVVLTRCDRERLAGGFFTNDPLRSAAAQEVFYASIAMGGDYEIGHLIPLESEPSFLVYLSETVVFRRVDFSGRKLADAVFWWTIAVRKIKDDSR